MGLNMGEASSRGVRGRALLALAAKDASKLSMLEMSKQGYGDEYAFPSDARNDDVPVVVEMLREVHKA